MFEFLIGTKINPDEFLLILNEEKERIRVLGGNKWYIVDFIKFQYGDKLNSASAVHASVIKILEDNNISYKAKPKKRGKLKIKLPKSVSEVAEHFQEKGSTKKEAESFFYFYESKGWKVGNNPMKNWKMAASGWISRISKGKPDPSYLSGQLDAMKK